MIKKLFVVIILILGTRSYSQETKSKTKSALGDNIAYFIKNKLVPKEELVAIKPDEIESVNVVKRDTIVDKKKYTSQIFVVLKSPNKYE
ncbi:MAG: hypothetical protein RLZZ236_75 [Bacteroidota bacterium]|jgi:hypothetical protein